MRKPTRLNASQRAFARSGMQRYTKPTTAENEAVTARALIGPTGYGQSAGIVWRNFPDMEERGGYSGPFDNVEEAAKRAGELAAHFGQSLEIEYVENVNRLDE